MSVGRGGLTPPMSKLNPRRGAAPRRRRKRARHSASVSAQRIRNGVLKPTDRIRRGRHAENQTGTLSGRISTASKAAAAQADGQRRADRAEKGQRRRPCEQRERDAHQPSGPSPSIRPKIGLAATSGRPVSSQCARHLTRTMSSSGVLGGQKEIERAILLIGLEQPVEAQQRREQRRDPEDRRTDAGQQRLIRADRERAISDHEDKKNTTPMLTAPPMRRPTRNSRAGGRRAPRDELAGFPQASRPSVRSRARPATGHGSRR